MIGRRMEMLILSSLMLALSLTVSARNRGNGMNPGPADREETCLRQVGWTAMPLEELSPEEENALRFMQEEEKLARDTYQALHELWGAAIFEKIAFSEQRHMDAVGLLLQKYGLPDSTLEEPGLFNNPDLQAAYERFVSAGSASLEEALLVGATIEDLDLFDLAGAMDQADNADILLVFENLSRGSRNHLRSFVGLLSLSGIAYQAQYLSPLEIEEILTSARETGGMGRAGRGRSAAAVPYGTASCQGN